MSLNPDLKPSKNMWPECVFTNALSSSSPTKGELFCKQEWAKKLPAKPGRYSPKGLQLEFQQNVIIQRMAEHNCKIY